MTAKQSSDDNVVDCPVCGEKTQVDPQEAEKKGYVLCPKGHKVELMHGLM